jgi:hypothetical protein
MFISTLWSKDQFIISAILFLSQIFLAELKAYKSRQTSAVAVKQIA